MNCWIFSVIVRVRCISEEFLIVEIVSLLWEQGKCCQFYPPTKKQQPAPLPLPCSALHWNFSLFFSGLIALILGAKWIVELPVPIHVWVDFFIFFFPPLIYKNELFQWDACVHLGFVSLCLWVGPSGCGIFHGNCFSCWLKHFLWSTVTIWNSQLKCPHFSFWIWSVFADSLATVDYNNEIFNILASSLHWDLFSASFSWAGQGEIFAVQFIFWNFSSGTISLSQTKVVADSLCLWCVLPIPCLY